MKTAKLFAQSVIVAVLTVSAATVVAFGAPADSELAIATAATQSADLLEQNVVMSMDSMGGQ